MKQLCNSAMRFNRTRIAFQHPAMEKAKKRLTGLFFFSAILLASCSKETANQEENIPALATRASSSEANPLNSYTALPNATMWELQQARASTAKYKNIENALNDGYVDINVVAPNMGYHFLKPAILDGQFDYKQPEILVYNKDEKGKFYLVAVEYAIPLSHPMPEGFSGSADIWDGNTSFNLWLLHAWVWSYNPEGVFNSTNPLVHLH